MSDDSQKPSEEMRNLNVQSSLRATNTLDENDNPTGGKVEGTGLSIEWQNGPRGQEGTDELAAPNGAFVEDAIWAAHQRLAFFQTSKYASDDNANAMTHLEAALRCLDRRRRDRADRGVEGKHEV